VLQVLARAAKGGSGFQPAVALSVVTIGDVLRGEFAPDDSLAD
jgi:hypothetical protein